MIDFGDSVSFEIVRFSSFRHRSVAARHPRPRVTECSGVCEPDSEIVRGTLGGVARSVPATGLLVLILCQFVVVLLCPPLSGSFVPRLEDVHHPGSHVVFLKGAS